MYKTYGLCDCHAASMQLNWLDLTLCHVYTEQTTNVNMTCGMFISLRRLNLD